MFRKTCCRSELELRVVERHGEAALDDDCTRGEEFELELCVEGLFGANHPSAKWYGLPHGELRRRLDESYRALWGCVALRFG